MLQAGAGGGISSAAQQISKFYLELARQTMPVIEVGAVRDVTLVISEGVELEIKEINKGEELQ
jgi:conjugal transfer pilus assembly protein TraB